MRLQGASGQAEYLPQLFVTMHVCRIVAMRQGRIARHGTPAELIRPDVLSDLYELPIYVHEIGGRRICVYYR